MERRTGFWWSPDSQSIAFAEVDATGISPFLIMYQGKSKLGGEAEEDHVYPFAGHPNVKVCVAVVPASGGNTTWMDLHVGKGGKEDEEEA
jgi:dipeptidyl-peptidase-4